MLQHVWTWSLKPLSHQSGVLTAFPQRLKKCRTPRCALCKRQKRCANAVETLCNRLERHAAAFKPLSHQTAMPQCLYSVLKPCQRAVGSSRNTPKISNLSVRACTQFVLTAFLQDLTVVKMFKVRQDLQHM